MLITHTLPLISLPKSLFLPPSPLSLFSPFFLFPPPQKKISFPSVTKYIILITDILYLESGGKKKGGDGIGGGGGGGSERCQRVEDIDCKWVLMAEKLWEKSLWVKIFHKMAQQSKETLSRGEVEGLKVLFFFFF